MVRDMDLIRDLMLKLEAFPSQKGSIWHFTDEEFLEGGELFIEGYTLDQISYHLNLITDAGLIEGGSNSKTMSGILFRSITWVGHDFLDSIRDPIIWEKTKKGALAAGGFTVDLLKDIAKGLLKKKVEDLTGVVL